MKHKNTKQFHTMHKTKLQNLTAIALTTLAFSESAHADYWKNSELIAKGTPNKQVELILKSDIAECSLNAKEKAQGLNPKPQCDILGPSASVACFMQHRDAEEKTKSVFVDLLLGCMAKRGWLLDEEINK